MSLSLGGCLARETAAATPGIGSAGLPSVAEVTFPMAQERLVRDLVRRMSLSELVGQMIMVSLELDQYGSPVLTLGSPERELLRALRPGGVILFGTNLDTVEQVHTLVRELQDTARIPLIVATDHEGGLVSRLTTSGRIGATVMPSATLVGIAGSVLVGRGEPERAADLTRRWGRAIGVELRSLGITMNMAPVADVSRSGDPGLLAIQRRTFGSDPDLVSDLAAAAVEGLHSAGVTAVIKHFPGQGAATLDSHTGAVSLSQSLDRLRAVDLPPFVAAIDAGARAVMSAHIAYPMVTGSDLPATVSPDMIAGLLRGELGFDGVVITDALNMDSVARGREGIDLALAAIDAGADIMLKPLDPVELHAALVDAVVSGMVSRGRLEKSVLRIAQLKMRAGLFGPGAPWFVPRARDELGSPEHLALVEEIRAIARSRRE